MQRDIVKNRVDILSLHFRQYFLAIDIRCQQNVVHMRVVLATFGHDRSPQKTFGLEWRQGGIVAVPNGDPPVGDDPCFLWLTVMHRGRSTPDDESSLEGAVAQRRGS